MSKHLHPQRRARFIRETQRWFPWWKVESMVFKKIGPYWVVRYPGQTRGGFKPEQHRRVRPGQLNRRSNAEQD